MLDLFRPSPPKTSPSVHRPRIPRRSKRHLVPVSDIPIRVHLLAGGVRHNCCQLWDISDHGACLLLRTPVTVGQQVLMRIYAPSSGEMVDLEARVMWLDEVLGTYYAGVQFAQPMDFRPTFLGPLFKNADRFSLPDIQVA